MNFFDPNKYWLLGILIALVLIGIWIGSLLARVDALERDVENIVDAVKYLSDNVAVQKNNNSNGRVKSEAIIRGY